MNWLRGVGDQAGDLRDHGEIRPQRSAEGRFQEKVRREASGRRGGTA
jgi:hypothetical protein